MAKEFNMRDFWVDRRMRDLFAEWLKRNPIMQQDAFQNFAHYQVAGRALSGELKDPKLKEHLDYIVRSLGNCAALLTEVIEVPSDRLPVEAPVACGGVKSLCVFQMQCIAMNVKVKFLASKPETAAMGDWLDDFDWLANTFQEQIHRMTVAEGARIAEQRQREAMARVVAV